MSDNAIHAIAGAGGGLVSMGLTYPLFTISTRLQVQRTGERKDAYKGNLDVLKKILNEEGVAGLFSKSSYRGDIGSNDGINNQPNMGGKHTDGSSKEWKKGRRGPKEIDGSNVPGNCYRGQARSVGVVAGSYSSACACTESDDSICSI
ncbi:Peroxisomal membrane protein PMP47A [Zancudomyces culisetae]|uniref:Peroxisomal membrane protein PMP47A n=1 Tax=Zancudomyces culisetae TaxID=1213189 RepID=A0A1R1PG01_ZANCU|nr:Peroxisomal membrane protein PMP47A [Zancudomyces culisetae]|eukprot:OMH79853.1 Peroxisomal membrane protein PMP47A [Zancudomyces culisetae]